LEVVLSYSDIDVVDPYLVGIIPLRGHFTSGKQLKFQIPDW
jgi:hypothetical protein